MRLQCLYEAEGFHDEDKFGDIYNEIFGLAITSKRDPELEKEILDTQNANAAYWYARDAIRGRWPEAEEIIKTNPTAAFYYAIKVIDHRWLEAEEIISRDPYVWEEYKDKFDIHESIVNEAEGFHDVDEFGDLGNIIIKLPSRDKEIEREILELDSPGQATYAFFYANQFHFRWPEAEKFIINDPWTAYKYAKHVLKGRWPEAENSIKREPYAAYWYARDVIKNRWPEAEEIIKTDATTWWRYLRHFETKKPKGSVKESKGMHDEDVFGDIIDDIKKLAGTGKRDSELEKEILDSGDPWHAHYYAHWVIKGRWPEAEEILKKNAGWWSYYKYYYLN